MLALVAALLGSGPAGADAAAPAPGDTTAVAPGDTIESAPGETLAAAPIEHEPATRRRPARRPLRDLGRAIQIFGSDAGAIVSAPARMDVHDALFLAGTIAATAVVFTNDEAILRASLRNGQDPVYRPVLRMGYNLEPLGLMGNTLRYYFGTVALGYAVGSPTLTLIPAELIESHFLAGGIRNLSKLLLGRRRPFEHQGARAFEFDGGTSFPSGHTSVVFEAATILSMHARRWPVTVVAYGLATTVAIQRVDSGTHWASDVIVPVITGTLIARTLVDRHRRTAWASAPRGRPEDSGAAGASGQTGHRTAWAVTPRMTSGGAPGVGVSIGF